MIDETLLEAEEKMDKALEVAKEDFAAIRTGRANAAMFSKIFVEYYGSPTPLQQLASFNVTEARTVLISPFDKTAMTAIEKALAKKLKVKNEMTISYTTVVALYVPPAAAGGQAVAADRGVGDRAGHRPGHAAADVLRQRPADGDRRAALVDGPLERRAADLLGEVALVGQRDVAVDLALVLALDLLRRGPGDDRVVVAVDLDRPGALVEHPLVAHDPVHSLGGEDDPVAAAVVDLQPLRLGTVVEHDVVPRGGLPDPHPRGGGLAGVVVLRGLREPLPRAGALRPGRWGRQAVAGPAAGGPAPRSAGWRSPAPAPGRRPGPRARAKADRPAS